MSGVVLLMIGPHQSPSLSLTVMASRVVGYNHLVVFVLSVDRPVHSGSPSDRFTTQPVPQPFGPYTPTQNRNKSLHS